MIDPMKDVEKPKMSEHRYYPLMVAAAYGVVSITITLFNKVPLPSRYGRDSRAQAPAAYSPFARTHFLSSSQAADIFLEHSNLARQPPGTILAGSVNRHVWTIPVYRCL